MPTTIKSYIFITNTIITYLSKNNQLLYLEIFSNIPISHNVINKELPPYERKGNVTPVIGIKDTTTIRFNNAWKESWNVIPNDKYFANVSLDNNDIFIPLYIIIKNKVDTINIPKNPNSSLIIANIKSVCGSGK